jgi:hypothetical protein
MFGIFLQLMLDCTKNVVIDDGINYFLICIFPVHIHTYSFILNVSPSANPIGDIGSRYPTNVSPPILVIRIPGARTIYQPGQIYLLVFRIPRARTIYPPGQIYLLVYRIPGARTIYPPGQIYLLVIRIPGARTIYPPGQISACV